MHFKTMAMKITRKNYSVAVACLQAGFTTIPIDDVVGKSYLIINAPAARGSAMLRRGPGPYMDYGRPSRSAPEFTIENRWESNENFFKEWGFVKEDKKDEFAEVERISQYRPTDCPHHASEQECLMADGMCEDD